MTESTVARTGRNDQYVLEALNYPGFTDNFDTKVVLSFDGCWNWTGATSSKRYGAVALPHAVKKTDTYCSTAVYAHRVAFIRANKREIAPGMTLDHLCLNKKCVRPSHLEEVTFGENTRRGHARRKAAAALMDIAA